MMLNGVRYTVDTYVDKKKNDDSFVYTVPNQIAQITKIIQLSHRQVVLDVRKVKVEPFHVETGAFTYFPQLQKMTGFGELTLMEPTVISGQCMIVPSTDETFVCKVPYGSYGD